MFVITTHYTTIMDHNTGNTIIEIAKRPRGRPKVFTEEEQVETMKTVSQRYYQKKHSEQKKEHVRLYYVENRDALRERTRSYDLRKKAEKSDT